MDAMSRREAARLEARKRVKCNQAGYFVGSLSIGAAPPVRQGAVDEALFGEYLDTRTDRTSIVDASGP